MAAKKKAAKKTTGSPKFGSAAWNAKYGIRGTGNHPLRKKKKGK